MTEPKRNRIQEEKEMQKTDASMTQHYRSILTDPKMSRAEKERTLFMLVMRAPWDTDESYQKRVEAEQQVRKELNFPDPEPLLD